MQANSAGLTEIVKPSIFYFFTLLSVIGSGDKLISKIVPGNSGCFEHTNLTESRPCFSSFDSQLTTKFVLNEFF
jgi:hypothetical protein